MNAELYFQPDLFKPLNEQSIFDVKLDALSSSHHNLRRGVHKRLNDLSSLLLKHQEQIAALEKQLMLVASNHQVRLPRI